LRIPWVTETLGKLISFHEHQHVDTMGYRLSNKLSGVGFERGRKSMEAVEKGEQSK